MFVLSIVCKTVLALKCELSSLESKYIVLKCDLSFKSQSTIVTMFLFNVTS
jgi:hypothetical protein